MFCAFFSLQKYKFMFSFSFFEHSLQNIKSMFWVFSKLVKNDIDVVRVLSVCETLQSCFWAFLRVHKIHFMFFSYFKLAKKKRIRTHDMISTMILWLRTFIFLYVDSLMSSGPPHPKGEGSHLLYLEILNKMTKLTDIYS